MAYEESLVSISLVADSSVGFYTGVPGTPGATDPNGGKQYHFVKITGVRTVGLGDASAASVGVLQNKPQGTGYAATVAISGVTKVVSDIAIASAGGACKISADGQATTAGAGPTVGIFLTTTANAGELVDVLLTL